MRYTYTPEGVCSKNISFDIDSEGKLRNVTFIGGCPRKFKSYMQNN